MLRWVERLFGAWFHTRLDTRLERLRQGEYE